MINANKEYIQNDVEQTKSLSFEMELDRFRKNVMGGVTGGAKLVMNGEIFDIGVDEVAISRYCTPSAELTAHLLYSYDTKKPSVTYDTKKPSVTNGLPRITNVVFNDPATIVFWEDGSKTVVKCNPDCDFYDPEKGLVMAMVKKIYGNKGSYFNEIKKWIKKYDEEMCGDEDELTYDFDISMDKFIDEFRKLKLAFGLESPSEEHKKENEEIKK